MTLTFETTLDIEPYGESVPIEVSFTYSVRHKELVIEAVLARVEGVEMPAWHLLSSVQRAVVEERCMDHHRDTVQGELEKLYGWRRDD